MATLRGEQIIARAFQREGVDTIFFMMGGPTGGTAGACLELGMKGIYVRHEQAAAMMAHAYARVTGKPGICIAPMGPGVANLVTGLANAWADAAPIIAIGGAVADARDNARHLPGDGPDPDDEADREGGLSGRPRLSHPRIHQCRVS